MGESGRDMITLPDQEITNLVNTAYRSLGDEEDAAYLSKAMEEQNQGFRACLIQKAKEEWSLVGDYGTREEGEIAPRDTLYPTMRVLSDSEKQPANHMMSATHESTYEGDMSNGTYLENRSCSKDANL